MRISVLGVGLIGGSIGLAARERLGAEVVGWDPEPTVGERAVALGALDEVAPSAAAAVAGAEAVFCAAPVSALPELVREALGAARADCVVSDVGSTKRELVELVAAEDGSERFVGGHPLAGAETAGVENARGALFEGARWYLTPTERSEGLLYDRLQRLVAELGARPQAIEAASHDRVMASVSHLPHVIANVLVAEAAGALASDSERLPEVGPSFRDMTRIAGANPSIWADIFLANAGPLAAGVESVAARLGEAAELLRAGDAAALSAWHRDALEARRELLAAQIERRELNEVRLVVANRPGTVAEIALALGRAGVNIEDMSLHPASDMRSGAISIWVGGAVEAERVVELAAGLGHAGSIVSHES